MSDTGRDLQRHLLRANRHLAFLTVVALSALSPALPHSMHPDVAWWVASWAIIAVMAGAGWLGSRRPSTHWLNTLAPMLLFPAIWCLRSADGDWRSGFSVLIFLPVVWFALYGRLREVWAAVIVGTLTVVLPILVIGAPRYPDASWRGTLLLVFVVGVLGPLIHKLVKTADATVRALRRSESEFRAAFEEAPVGMAITGLHGDEARRFVRANRALCNMFGRTEQELTSVPISELTHPDDRERTDERFEQVLDPQVPRRIEKRYVHKSGRTLWVSVWYSVVYDEQGNATHLISQIEDLGPRRESEQALLDAFETDREVTERLKQVEQIRADMASTVSHELRTPLTSAAGYVELLLEGDAGALNDEQRDMLDTVARSLNRLDGIVDDVLGMATPGRHGPVDPGSTNLQRVLRSAVEAVTLQAAARGQDLIVHDDLSDAVVAGNPGRIERVIVNLLTNALKFTPEDGTITVTGKRSGGEATIAVTDTGIGISPADQQRIFERFYRADSAAEAQTSGTGLGLAIAQTITHQYGGKLTVHSEPNRGSTFTLTLPLRERA